jgi:hypothetical protein
MNRSKLSRLFTPAVTVVSLASWVIWSAYVAGRPLRKASYAPRHARPRR